MKILSMHIPAAALLANALLLSGCAHYAKALVEGPTTATPLPMAPAATGGSLFPGRAGMNYGYRPMFEDRRPRNVGDTLTITAAGERERQQKVPPPVPTVMDRPGMGLIAVPSKLNSWLGDGKADFEAEGKNDFAGKGGAAAQYNFTGTITVTVKSCCPTAPRRGGREADCHQQQAPNLSASPVG